MLPYLLVAVLASSVQAADVVDRFFETKFKFHPTEATAAGFHEYDEKLEDYSRAAKSEERRVGKECRSRCDWSSDVCSSDLSRSLLRDQVQIPPHGSHGGRLPRIR